MFSIRDDRFVRVLLRDTLSRVVIWTVSDSKSYRATTGDFVAELEKGLSNTIELSVTVDGADDWYTVQVGTDLLRLLYDIVSEVDNPISRRLNAIVGRVFDLNTLEDMCYANNRRESRYS